MQFNTYFHVVAAVFAVSLGACDHDDDYEPEDEEIVIDNTVVNDAVTYRSLFDNGIELNGAKLNGTKLNGTKLNGTKLNGTKLNGSAFNSTAFGGSVNGMGLSGWSLEPGTSKLRATGTNSTVYAGNALVDSELDWEVDDAVTGVPFTAKMKVRGVSQSSEHSDIFYTDLIYKNPSDVWESFCKDGANNDVEAIAMPGYFNDATAEWRDDEAGAVAFGCRGTAAGKCIEWGYRMWATVGGDSLANYYRACTRMVRADYCGNNVTHTVNGNPIDVSDKQNVQVPGTAWPVEAKWGPNGAVCINTPRRAAWTREAVIAECEAAGKGTLPNCTNNDASEFGGLLMTQANAL